MAFGPTFRHSQRRLLGFERKTDILANGLILLISAGSIWRPEPVKRAAKRQATEQPWSCGQRFIKIAGKPIKHMEFFAAPQVKKSAWTHFNEAEWRKARVYRGTLRIYFNLVH